MSREVGSFIVAAQFPSSRWHLMMYRSLFIACERWEIWGLGDRLLVSTGLSDPREQELALF